MTAAEAVPPLAIEYTRGPDVTGQISTQEVVRALTAPDSEFVLVNEIDPHKLAYSIDEACHAVGCCKATLYVYIHNGQLDARRFGDRKTLITAPSLRALINNLPKAEIKDVFEAQGSPPPPKRRYPARVKTATEDA